MVPGGPVEHKNWGRICNLCIHTLYYIYIVYSHIHIHIHIWFLLYTVQFILILSICFKWVNGWKPLDTTYLTFKTMFFKSGHLSNRSTFQRHLTFERQNWCLSTGDFWKGLPEIVSWRSASFLPNTSTTFALQRWHDMEATNTSHRV